MTLDVETPDPPTLHGPQNPSDYDAVDEPEEWTGDEARREQLAGLLEAGAWADGFEEWAADTYLTDDEFRTVRELGLLEAFDFYWNQSASDVGYRSPTVPADSDGAVDLDDGDIEDIEEELDSLGWIVSEVLESDYIDSDGNQFGYSWE